MKARPPPLLLLSTPLPQSSKKGWGQMAGVEGWTVFAWGTMGHRGAPWGTVGHGVTWGRWESCAAGMAGVAVQLCDCAEG